MERTNRAGEPSEFPPGYLGIDVPDGVVMDATFVERTAPSALHSQENLEEDDDFLSVGTETWDYAVADGRQDEFLAAVKNSRMAVECEALADERSLDE